MVRVFGGYVEEDTKNLERIGRGKSNDVDGARSRSLSGRPARDERTALSSTVRREPHPERFASLREDPRYNRSVNGTGLNDRQAVITDGELDVQRQHRFGQNRFNERGYQSLTEGATSDHEYERLNRTDYTTHKSQTRNGFTQYPRNGLTANGFLREETHHREQVRDVRPAEESDRDDGTHISLTELICQKPEDVFCAQDRDGDNEVMLAIIKKASEYAIMMITWLVRRGSSKLLNLRNNDGYTALHLAVKVNLLDVTLKLTEAKVDYEIRDNQGHTPLHWACILGHTDQAKALTGNHESQRNSRGKTQNRTNAPQSNGVQQNQTAQSTDPTVYRKYAELLNYKGWNCLHLAALHTQTEVMEYLVLVLRMDVNSRGGSRGMGVIHIAIESQDVPLIVFISRRLKADVNLRTYDGWDAIEFAGFRNDTVTAKVLLNYGGHASEFRNCKEKATEFDRNIDENNTNNTND